MDFLPGFAWPVPRAFASAVSVCRFEQGDVLFDHADAYGAWKSGRKRKARRYLQVLDPPRSSRSAPADAEGNRFAANWASPARCELGEIGAGAEVVESTQGRLFTCLWRGDDGLLVAGADAAELPRPATARDLQKQLEGIEAGFRAASGLPASGTCFLLVVDHASESSLAKARDVEAALSARYALDQRELSPADAGVEGGDAYHPALLIRGSWVDESRPDAVRELLKRALYGPGAGGADRFVLERHGLLAGPVEAPPG